MNNKILTILRYILRTRVAQREFNKVFDFVQNSNFAPLMINIQFYHRRSKVLKSATFHRCSVKLGYHLGRALKNPTKIVHFTSGRRRGGGFFAERFFPWSLFPKSLDSSETVRSRAKPDCCEEITYPSLPLTSSIQRQYQTQKINFTFTLHLFYRENIIKHYLPTEACLNLCDTVVF